MESLMKPVTLTQDVSKVLDEIRAGAENALYGAGPDVSEELFTKHIVSLIEGAGLPVLQTMHYRWFLRELARLWRTRQGRDLAFHLELCIRKWVGLGLEPKTLQFLVCETHQRLKGQDSTTKTQSHEEAGEMETAKDAKIAKSEPDSPTGTGQSVESAESVDDSPAPGSAPSADVRGPDPEPASTTKTPRHEENPGSVTGILESSTPRILPVDFSRPGCMAGPRPPADPATGPLESSNPGILP